MTKYPPPIINTKRLVLTWPTAKQIDDYYHTIINTNIFDTIFWEGPSSPQDLHDWWQDNRQRDPSDLRLHFPTAVIQKSSGRYIGGVGLRPNAVHPAIMEIGYAFAVQYHGKGYATEAIGAMVDEAFRERKAERICANVFVGNHASRRVVEKLGFVYEGTQRRCVYKRGTWLDQWTLAIIRPDWETRQRTTTKH